MEFIQISKCLCDEGRLRILNLLLEGPLCVCHVHEILEEPQSKTSKQLAMMREAGLLENERCYNWTIYRLTSEPHPVLEENLKCLRDLRATEEQFGRDLERRERVVSEFSCTLEETPALAAALGSGKCC